jgi:DNA-binding NtrC family response regulator
MSTTAVGTASVKDSGLGSEDYPAGVPALVVDDDADVRSVISKCLRKFKVGVVEAESLAQAREMFEEGEQFSMVFLDRCLPDGDGVEFSREVMDRQPGLAVVIVTGQGSADNANVAIAGGAFGYIPKPCQIADIRNALLRKYPTLSDAFHDGSATGPVIDGSSDDEEEEIGVRLIGNSSVMIRVALEIGEIAKMTRPVLITGKSGTGKEVVAQKIHEMSSRAGRKFVAVNCGAMPQELIESTLFGHTRGAFTGATVDRKGVFEEADGGTIFLDEITETTAAFQVKLLRVLQEHRVTRVGSNQEIKLDVRVIASSNRNVVDEVTAGRFREDLYFRLKGSEIFLPPLQDRREDVMPLVLHFAGITARKTRRKVAFSTAVLSALKAYDWPGNVRELESVIDSAVQRCNGVVLLSDLPRDLREIGDDLVGDLVGDLNENEVAVVGAVVGTTREMQTLEEVEDAHMQRVLRHCNGNKTQAAKMLGLDRSAFGKKCRENGWGVKIAE